MLWNQLHTQNLERYQEKFLEMLKRLINESWINKNWNTNYEALRFLNLPSENKKKYDFMLNVNWEKKIFFLRTMVFS